MQCKKTAAKPSKYRGVYWVPADNIWAAKICVQYASKGLGRYLNEEDAARAWDKAARHYRGKNTWVNFPEEKD